MGNRKYLLWGIAAAYMILIFLVSSFSALPSQLTNINDKLLHFIEFFILALLLLLALINSNIKYPYLTAIIIAVSFAILDEVHQLFVLGRSANIFDFIADSLGILTILLGKLKKYL